MLENPLDLFAHKGASDPGGVPVGKNLREMRILDRQILAGYPAQALLSQSRASAERKVPIFVCSAPPPFPIVVISACRRSQLVLLASP